MAPYEEGTPRGLAEADVPRLQEDACSLVERAGLLQVALGERLGVLLAPHLGGGDADQRSSTHVSLKPPFWIELTTSWPSSTA